MAATLPHCAALFAEVMTSENRAVERAYYVVTDDSDKDDDVVSSCDSALDDVIKKRHESHKPVSFRLLRAHHADKRRGCAKHRHQNTSEPITAMLMPPLPVPVANSNDVDPAALEKAVIDIDVETSVGPSRMAVCLSFSKRFLAFLLSTAGLSILTVVYSVLGGLLFAALEGPYEEKVKSNVRESLDKHVSDLWILTSRLNVLHPVSLPFTLYSFPFFPVRLA